MSDATEEKAAAAVAPSDESQEKQAPTEGGEAEVRISHSPHQSKANSRHRKSNRQKFKILSQCVLALGLLDKLPRVACEFCPAYFHSDCVQCVATVPPKITAHACCIDFKPVLLWRTAQLIALNNNYYGLCWVQLENVLSRLSGITKTMAQQ